jgi:DNA-binding NtrC family response regulator
MTSPDVIVVEETPSLARSLITFLESEGLNVASANSTREVPGLLAAVTSDAPVLVSASNGRYCESARRWLEGELGDGDLVVVGTRDPHLQSKGRLHVVALPLKPDQLVELIRKLQHASRMAVAKDAAPPDANFHVEPW